MADVITRFKLETTHFDSKLRDTAKALKDVTHQASLGGKDFNNFSKKAIESARALGTVQSGATNTKDKLRDLVGSYNDAAKAYNELTDAAKKGEFGKAMSTSLQQLQQRIRETKQELYSLGDSAKGTGGGGLFGGGKLDGMLQVFGGNLMTKGAGMALGFAAEMKDMVAQGIELAKQGEGIRIAFQRLGRGDILDGLRQATHGTVTDLELMKAAVKFNDFKLPLDELGTMLAFAQQKAKDTGQSVDYMVDSIVTGLGRKSLMILDNLGLSAAQIKERMAETGDMTKAVGAIIREEMAKAGDYVETAADRATQANVALQNKMEELGRKFAPVEEASNQLWTSIKIGILDIVGGPLADLLNGLTRAGQLRKELKNIGSDERVNSDVAKLKGSNFKQQAYTAMLNKYSREEQRALDNFKKAQKGGMGSIAIWENRYLAQKAMREDFQRRGREVLNGGNSKNTSTTPTNTITPTGTTTPVPVKIEGFDPSAAATAGTRGVDTMPSVFGMLKDSDAAGINGAMGSIMPDLSADIEKQTALVDELREKLAGATGDIRDSIVAMVIEAEDKLRNLKDEQGISQGDGRKPYDLGHDISTQWKLNKKGQLVQKGGEKQQGEYKSFSNEMANITQGVSGIVSGIEQLGIDIPEGLKSVLGGIQAVAGILTGISALVTIITAIQGTKTVPVIGWMLARGGVVHAAGGYQVPGNRMSGDQVPAMLNSGELVLNKFQQEALAANLQAGGMQNLHLEASVHGEQIVLAVNNTMKRKNKGELATFR